MAEVADTTTLYEDPALGLGNEGDMTMRPSSGIGVSANDSGPDPLRAAVDEMNAQPGIGVSAPQQAQQPQADTGFWPKTAGGDDKTIREMIGLGPTHNTTMQRMQEKQAKYEQLKTSLSALEEGVKVATGMVKGDEKDNYIESYAGKLDAIDKGVGDTFKAISKNPGFAEQIGKYSDKSPTLKRALEIDPTGRTAFKLMQSPEAQGTIQKEIDANIMPTILKKGQTLIMGWQHLLPTEMVDKFNKDGRLSASELIQANEWIRSNNPTLAKTLALNDEELGTIHRNSEAFYHTLGVVSPKDEGQVLVAGAKGEVKQPPTRTQPVMKGGVRMEQQQEWKNGKWENVGDVVPHFKPEEGAPNAVPAEYADLHGDDYLKKLMPGDAGLIKGIGEGKIDPKTLSTRGGHREKVLQQVVQAFPDFDQTNYSARYGVRKDFTSGVASRNVTAINTAIGHLGTMQELGDKLDNRDLRAWNQVANALGVQLGKDQATNFDVVQGAVADELMRVFRQVGASQQEADAWRAKFPSKGSPTQIKGAITTAADLLGSRIESLDDQWKRGMNTDAGYPKLLSDKSKSTFKKIGGNLGRYGISESGGGSGGSLPPTNAKGYKLMVDGKGNRAYVGPNNEIEPVK